MYLHLGQNVVVAEKEVVAIFDLDNASYSRHTRRFLELAQKRGQVVNVCDDLPRSVALCMEKDGMRLYVSQISSQTLLKRAESGQYSDAT